MQCAICGIQIETQVLEIAGIKVPPLCERHMRWVNQALGNQKKHMEEHFGKETSGSQRSGRETSWQIDQGSRREDPCDSIQGLFIDGCLD